MTKVRHPLTFELALTRVAGLIDWPRCAAIVGVAESTLRSWSDPDVAAGVRIDRALILDLAYQRAGGVGAPFFDCYALRLEIEVRAATGEQLLQSAATTAKESGEAVASLMRATQPGASDIDRSCAIRELEESIAAHQDTLANLRAGRGSDRDDGGPRPPQPGGAE